MNANLNFQRTILIALIGTGLLSNVEAAEPVGLIPRSEVKVRGYVGERLSAIAQHHVAATDIDYITAPFKEKTERTGRWQSEFWGKFMHSAYEYDQLFALPGFTARIEQGVETILASQEASGYIGNYPEELRCRDGWDVWGMKYTMLALLHVYEQSGNAELKKRALAAAERLCDYVLGELGPNGRRQLALWQTGNWSGLASSSILEPVVWLYRVTKKAKYLDFAAYVAEGMEKPETGPRLVDLALKGISVADRNGYGNQNETGGYVIKHNRCKAYETMSCYQGLLEYWQAKTEGGTKRDATAERYREAAIKAAEQILKDEINLAGGATAHEAWFHGAVKQHLVYERMQETCVTTTWMRLCEKLLMLTDDPKWADELERTFYNIYLAAMKRDGSAFSAYVPLTGSRSLGHDHCYMHTDCCTANGPRGALCFLHQYFHRDAQTATFNFYGTASAKGFDMYSTYPRDPTARITSHTEGPLKLRLRIPAWSHRTEIRLNNQVLTGVKCGSYFEIDRQWRLGDVLVVNFDMPVVAHTLDRGKYVAFTYGPILLARDSRFGDGDLAEPLRHGTKYAENVPVPDFRAVRSPSSAMWMAFSATLPIGAHVENAEGKFPSTVFFCDYASAGNSWRRDDYYRTWFPIERGLDD